MSLVLNTNIASVNAQKSLWSTGNDLSVAMQRLSSGLRINSAKDDSAGYMIAGKMTSQINGMTQAVTNSNNANGMLQTMMGTMGQMQDALQRMNELAVEASDASYSQDKSSISTEYNDLRNQIQNMATQTQFNGMTLLDGTLGETVTLNAGSHLTTANGIASITANGATVSTANYKLSITTAGAPVGQLAVTMTNPDGTTQTLDLQPPTGYNTQQLNFSDGVNVTFNSSVTNNLSSFNAFTVSGATSLQFQTGERQGDTIDVSGYNLTVSNSAQGLGVYLFQTTLNGTQTQAQDAITQVGLALNALQSEAGEIGAKSNQLDSQIANLQSVSQNTQAAKSQLTDADFAAETAQMNKDLVLQQAGISVLAQANQQPQMILKLLQ